MLRSNASEGHSCRDYETACRYNEKLDHSVLPAERYKIYDESPFYRRVSFKITSSNPQFMPATLKYFISLFVFVF